MHSANPIPSMPDKSKELLYELCHLWPTRETRPSSIRGSSLRHPSKTKGMKGSKARSSLSAVGLALLAAILPGACIPRLVASPEIDQFIRDEMELNKIPALSLAIVRQGEIKLVRAYGVRSIESRRPMTLDTPVDLASLSKALTALAILRIEREGSIKRSANVYEVLPGLAGSDWTGVTLNHLLQHRSGLRRGHDFLLPCCASPGDFDPAIAIELLSGADLVGFPGETMSYANSNYVLLAAIIEQSSGIPFRDYMRQSVFLPLGMRNTSIDRSDPALKAGAMRHEWQWGRVRVSPSSFAGWSGSSRVKSSAADMAAYLDALLSPKPGCVRVPAFRGPLVGPTPVRLRPWLDCAGEARLARRRLDSRAHRQHLGWCHRGHRGSAQSLGGCRARKPGHGTVPRNRARIDAQSGRNHATRG